jgi:hypothetical protein
MNREKNRLNRLKFWKNRPVRFDFSFISLKLKNEPNRTKKKNQKKPEPKPSQTEPKRFELIFVLKNQTETGRFEPVSVFFF